MAVEEKLSDEIRESFVKSFNEVVGGVDSKWMACLWQVKDGKITRVRTSTHDFPTGDFLEAVSQLAHYCFDLAKPNRPEEPLPLASFLKTNERLKGLLDQKEDGEEPCDG